MVLLKRAFHIVPCALGEDPTASLRAEAAAHPATGGAGKTDGVQIVAKVTGPLTDAVKASGWCPCPKEQCADPDAVRLLVTPFTQGAHLYRVIQEEGRRELDTPAAPAALDELANEAFKAVKFPYCPLYAWRVEKL